MAKVYTSCLLFFFLLTSLSFGSDCLTTLKSLADLRADTSLYCPSMCHENVHRLIGRLKEKEPEFKIEDADVIFVYPESRPSLLFSLGAVNYEGGWHFHVALRYQGKVYDLDQKENTPSANLKEYVKTMFVGDEEARKKRVEAGMEFYGNLEKAATLSETMVRVIPAADYLREYGNPHDSLFYRQKESQYPTQSVKDLFPDEAIPD